MARDRRVRALLHRIATASAAALEAADELERATAELRQLMDERRNVRGHHD